MRSIKSKCFTLESAAHEIQRRKHEGQRIVTTNGCFDILHRGHIDYLEKARALGDALFVAINSDSSVRKLKGTSRPVIDQDARMATVAALECVDGVFAFEEDTPVAWLQKLKPHVHVKGGDYKGKELVERETIEAHGGKLVIVDLTPGFSTSSLIEKLHGQH